MRGGVERRRQRGRGSREGDDSTRLARDQLPCRRVDSPVETKESWAPEALAQAGFAKVDYVEVRGAEDLARLGPGPVATPARILAAAFLGRTRLIDNMAV